MSQKTLARYGSEGREDLLKLHAEKILLPEDPKHPAWNGSRHALPPDEGLIASILLTGQLQPIGVTFDDEGDVVCEFGEQRVKAIREINKRGKKRVPGYPQTELLVRAVGRGLDDSRMMHLARTVENMHRRQLSPLECAEEAQRMLTIDPSLKIEDVATAFDKTAQTIRDWLALLKCAAPVKKAVAEGVIGADAARKLGKLPKKEQFEALEKMVKAGATKGKKSPAARRARAALNQQVKLTQYEWWILHEAIRSIPTGAAPPCAERLGNISNSAWFDLVAKIAARAAGYEPLQANGPATAERAEKGA